MIIKLSSNNEIKSENLCKHKGPRFTDCQTNQIFCGNCGYVFCDKLKEKSVKQ